MSILGKYLQARESSYFKTEQEAQLQLHREKLLREGRLDDRPGGRSQGPSFDDSAALFEVLPEVHQARTRVDDPHAARRKHHDRRAKGEAAPVSEEDLRRYRAAAYGGMGAAVGHIPRISLSGRNRYGIHHLGSAGGDVVARQVRRALSPEAQELARRSFMASVRAAAYGGLLGVALVALGGTAAVQALQGSGSGGGGGGGGAVKERIRAACEPFAEAARAWAAPVKLRAQAWAAPGVEGQGTDRRGGGAAGEFQARLQHRYNPKSAPTP